MTMTQATSNKLNLPLRTVMQAKGDVFGKRFRHFRNFTVRSVFLNGEHAARSYPVGVEPDLDALADAFGVYGDDMTTIVHGSHLQHHVHDCGTIEEAQELADILNVKVLV
jgi:hypothetical protein